jgi:ubiquinol-cytochrome c reductase iron-sulfur subunit
VNGGRGGREARWATGRIALALLVSTACSIGLTVLYAMGGQPQLEGALLGGTLGGLSVAFVLWGKHLMPGGGYVEERLPMEPPHEEREAFLRAYAGGERMIARRAFLSRMLLLALGALGAALVFPIRSLGPGPKGALFRTAWRRGLRLVTPDGQPVRAEDVTPGGVLTVFPQGHTDAADSQTILIRADPALIRPVPGREDWSPDGLLAYSKICTHAGCPVGLYEQRTGRLFCPCHQSVFDVLNGARPEAGPATRPLPQLPIEVDREGFLRARGDFSAPVGPGFWDLSEG